MMNKNTHSAYELHIAHILIWVCISSYVLICFVCAYLFFLVWKLMRDIIYVMLHSHWIINCGPMHVYILQMHIMSLRLHAQVCGCKCVHACMCIRVCVCVRERAFMIQERCSDLSTSVYSETVDASREITLLFYQIRTYNIQYTYRLDVRVK